jgi:hypothetical protein
MEPTKVILQGFDILDIVRFISKTNKKCQATILASLETVIDSSDYPTVRKIVLDGTNDFTRTIVKNIFGDIDI